MSKQRINILTPIPFWHPGTLELIDELRKNDFDVVALDIWDFKYYDEMGFYHDLIPFSLKSIFAKVYIRLNRRRIICKYIRKTDVVDIQWCGHYYSKYMHSIKRNGGKIIATLFGSDFYRSSEQEKQIQSKIFDIANCIVIGPNMREDFLHFFPSVESKLSYGQYGSKRLEIIDEINTDQNKIEFRRKYLIPDEKMVTTLGYNAKPEQQHVLFLDILKGLTAQEKSKIFLLIPMTYGKVDAYTLILKQKLEEIGIDYLCVENSIVTGDQWLTDLELAELRVISDVTVNIQTTDALSSSIKEALLSGDVVITGEWLPYGIFEEIGVFLIRSKKEDLLTHFKNVIYDFPNYKSKGANNRDYIFNFASWQKLIPQFINRYSNI